MRFDGGSRGNPGIAGCGAVIYKDDEEIWSGYKYLGNKQTNNYAEYSGLLLGLENAQKLGIQTLAVEGDSLLVIQQMTKRYACRSENLIELYTRAMQLSSQFNSLPSMPSVPSVPSLPSMPSVTFTHIRRNKNKRADELSNMAMDSSVCVSFQPVEAEHCP